jgi:hypothetical protein
MKTYVEFRSDRFPPEQSEDERINPGIYGKRLAGFLVDGLRGENFEPEEPLAETGAGPYPSGTKVSGSGTAAEIIRNIRTDSCASSNRTIAPTSDWKRCNRPSTSCCLRMPEFAPNSGGHTTSSTIPGERDR